MLKRMQTLARSIKTEVTVYVRIMRHRRTPWIAKALLMVAFGYLAMPFDLIPDFIPLVGHLDDVIIVPALIFLALAIVPREVVAECRSDHAARRK